MIKIMIVSLFTKNKKYAAASKIEGGVGYVQDGTLLYIKA